MEKETVIVGGGVGGLLAARALSRAGRPFLGLEAGSQLGGRLEVGHHRLQVPVSVDTLREIRPEGQFEAVDEPPQERRKGEWVSPGDDFGGPERFYLGPSFFTGPFKEILQALVDEVGASFRTRKIVTEVNPEERTVVCQDGSRHLYEDLVWCAPLKALTSVWKGNKGPLHKALGKLPPPPGGLSLDMELKGELFPHRNTVVFPFRFKDYRLRALGVSSPRGEGKTLLQWIVFLEEGLLEDREEVAKCVRTLKRELPKEFPRLTELLERERLVYLPVLSSEEPVGRESLEILPHLLYLGPEMRLPEEAAELRNLDLTLSNYRKFTQILKIQ